MVSGSKLVFRLTEVQLKKKKVLTSLVHDKAVFHSYWWFFFSKSVVWVSHLVKKQTKPSRYSAGKKSKVEKMVWPYETASVLCMSSRYTRGSKDSMSEPKTAELAAALCPGHCYFVVCFQLMCQWELFFMVTLATRSI